MNIRRIFAIVLCLVGLATGLILAVHLSNPARRAPAAIRAHLLSLAPRGTPIADAKALLVAYGWDQGKCWTEDAQGNWSQISARYGEYNAFFNPLRHVIVQAHWDFDDEGKLTDVSLHYWEGLIGYTEFHVEK